MYGYIVPDVVQKDLKAVKKYNDKSKIIFSMETDSTPERYESVPTATPDGRSRITQGGSITEYRTDKSTARNESAKTNFPPPPVTSPFTILNNLPTSDPNVSGAIWNDNGTLKISNG